MPPRAYIRTYVSWKDGANQGRRVAARVEGDGAGIGLRVTDWLAGRHGRPRAYGTRAVCIVAGAGRRSAGPTRPRVREVTSQD